MQPSTSKLLFGGFLCASMSTLFTWNSWLFLTNTVVIICLAVYFKRISDLLLGFILGVVLVHLHIYLNGVNPDIDAWHKTPVTIHVQSVFHTGDSQYTQSSICVRDDDCIKGYLSFSSVRETPTQAQRYRGVVSIKPYRSNVHFLGHNKELKAYLNHIVFKGRVLSIESQMAIDREWRQSLREFWSRSTKGLAFQSLYYTLITGDKGHFDPEIRAQFQLLGLSHMLAISGMHVGIIYLLGFWSSRLCIVLCILRSWQSRDLNRWSAIVGLFVSGVYVYICFAPVSAQRAFIMLCGVVFCYLAGRKWTSFNAILFALFLVIVFNPFAWLDLGLYFSFIAFSAVLVGLNICKRFKVHPVMNLLVIQLCCFVLLMPLSVFFFAGVSVSGIWVNIIAIPFLTFVLFPVLLLELFSLAMFEQLLILPLLDDAISWAFKLTSQIPEGYHWLGLPNFSWQLLMLLYATLLLSLTPIFRVYAVALLMLCSAQFAYQRKAPPSLTVFDVGHGTMVLIQFEGKGLVYDLGPSYFGSYNYVDRVLLPHFRQYGLDEIDVLLSHDDADHTGGLNAFIRSEYAKSNERGYYFNCDQFAAYNEKGLHIESIWPLQPPLLVGDNNKSCVLKITVNGFSVLLAGDIEQAAEQYLVSTQSLASTIVLVPHHGSKSSSSVQFVKNVAPQYAVFSRAFYNPWRIPSNQVVDRYLEIGAKIYDTALDGDIRFEFQDDKIVVKTARQERSWWFLGN